MDFTEMGSFSQQMAQERQIRQAQLGSAACEALRQRRLVRRALRRDRARSMVSILSLRRHGRERLDLGMRTDAFVAD